MPRDGIRLMPRDPFSIGLTLRRKLVSVLVAMGIFACLGGVTTLAVGRPVELGVTNAVLIGAGIGLFEEFYVQSQRGNWLRAMHPLLSIPVYVGVIIVLYFVAVHISHVLLGRLDDLPTVYRRLPYGLTFFTVFSVVGVLMMRIIHFIGLENLFHLMVGTYHRPVQERKVLLFLDINGSTALGEKLGALATRSLVGKFLFDVSQPITDHGGDIYLFKGDGLIAVWDWTQAIKDDSILRAIDAMFGAVARERGSYQRLFGVAPDLPDRGSRRRRGGERAGRYQALDRYLRGYDQHSGPHGRGRTCTQRAMCLVPNGCRVPRGPQPNPRDRRRGHQGHLRSHLNLRISAPSEHRLTGPERYGPNRETLSLTHR